MLSQSIEYYIHRSHGPLLAFKIFKCSKRHEPATTDGGLTIIRMPLYIQTAWDIPQEQLTKAWNAAMKAEDPFAVKKVQTISANKRSQKRTKPVQGF